jgi:hypothetical protein
MSTYRNESGVGIANGGAERPEVAQVEKRL